MQFSKSVKRVKNQRIIREAKTIRFITKIGRSKPLRGRELIINQLSRHLGRASLFFVFGPLGGVVVILIPLGWGTAGHHQEGKRKTGDLRVQGQKA